MLRDDEVTCFFVVYGCKRSPLSSTHWRVVVVVDDVFFVVDGRAFQIILPLAQLLDVVVLVVALVVACCSCCSIA